MINSKTYMAQIETNQNFYHLACIISASLGIPTIIVGKEIAVLYGAGTAICSILIGNLILWLIGLAIISMTYEEKSNAVKNIQGYFGKKSALLFALILTLTFLNWYVLQISKSIISLETLYQYSYPWKSGSIIQIGAVIGLISALLSIGGITLLRWFTSITFPLIVLYNICIIATSEFSLFSEASWGVSFLGTITTTLTILPGVVNLPTFFRHAKSRSHSFLGLSLLVTSVAFFECSSIWMSFSQESEFVLNGSTIPNLLTYVIPTTLFLGLSAISANMVNIYLASACYETFIKKLQGAKGHAIMGLLGTAMYTFVQISKPVKFIENLLTDYIAVLGIVLIIAVLSRLIVRHRPRRFEKIINSASWLVGCVVVTILQLSSPYEGVQPLLMGMGACVLFFLIVFFLEETVWSVQKLRKGDVSSS